MLVKDENIAIWFNPGEVFLYSKDVGGEVMVIDVFLQFAEFALLYYYNYSKYYYNYSKVS